MNPIVRRAEVALRDHPHPALRIGELLELVADDVHRWLDASSLQRLLEEHPDTFRVLDPWRGPWRRTRAPADRQCAPGEPWVVLVADPGGSGQRARTPTRLRDSVRWLARAVDPRSVHEVSRWYAIALAERAARDALARRAA